MIASSSLRTKLMDGILAHLLVVNSVEDRNREGELARPEKFELEQNYANPFGPSTVIRFHIPIPGYATLKIYNSIGQVVRTLENRNFKSGTFDSVWNGRNEQGLKVPNGIYFSVLTYGNVKLSKKIIVLAQ